MSDRGGYGQFCPVAMASEVLCSRWTTLVVRELLCGSVHFNDLRRGVPRMSPALLSKRLKELEKAGVVQCVPNARGVTEYHLTQAGEDLRPVIMGLGFWGQRWVDSHLSLQNLDPTLLMWDMRRRLRPDPMPPRRCTIRFEYGDAPPGQRVYWMIVDGGTVDLCAVDPGFEIDLYVTSRLRSMVAVWMGAASLRQEMAAGRISVDGDASLARTMAEWLGLSAFAPGERKAG